MSRLFDRADAMIYYLHVADELEALADLVQMRSPNGAGFGRKLELLAHEIRRDVRLTGWLELE